jgi:hypothetical protein
MEEYTPLIIMGSLLVLGIFILKIALAISKAEVRRNMKWVAGSFIIQFGLIFFISSPMMLHQIFIVHGEPRLEMIIPTIIICFFIDMNAINVIHRIGIKKSGLISIFLIGPVTVSLYFLGAGLASLVYIY